MSNRVFIISWPSGVWKTTIWKLLVDMDTLNFEKIVTTTTRQPREWESYWLHYYFVDSDRFHRLIEQWRMIEYAFVHWNYYWSTYEELERIISDWKIPLYIVDHQWAVFLKDKLTSDYKVETILLYPPSELELRKRLKERWSEDDTSFKVRFEESMEQLKHKDFYDHIIVNDIIEETIDKFIELISNAN